MPNQNKLTLLNGGGLFPIVIFREFGVSAPVVACNGDFTPTFFNFVVLPSLFSFEASVYPCFNRVGAKSAFDFK